MTTSEISESETADGVGELVRMDQGETVPARASLGESTTTSELSKEGEEGKGEAGCAGTGGSRDGDMSTGKVREGDGVCRRDWGSGMSMGETELG